MSRLKSLLLLREGVRSWTDYPFRIPAIASLQRLEITSSVCFFVGENGTGKSTLLEAIAAHYGFGREGGSRDFAFETTQSVRAVDPLARALRLAFTTRTGRGFYLRAESFFNVASYLDTIGRTSGGGASLHEQSHGESFISALRDRLRSPGFYVMDEPEGPLSFQSQLSLLALIHDLASERSADVQFLVATHSPILLAFPGAQILSFDGDKIAEISYRDSQPFKLMSRFMSGPEEYVKRFLSNSA